MGPKNAIYHLMERQDKVFLWGGVSTQTLCFQPSHDIVICMRILHRENQVATGERFLLLKKYKCLVKHCAWTKQKYIHVFFNSHVFTTLQEVMVS